MAAVLGGLFVLAFATILWATLGRSPAAERFAEAVRRHLPWCLTLGAAGALILLSFAADSPAPLILLVIAAAVLFVVTWVRDFAYLMTQPDSAFPGRHDKLIWALLLIVLPPVGVLTFWSYRRAHATEPKPAGSVEWL
jgi:hypothetical protein